MPCLVSRPITNNPAGRAQELTLTIFPGTITPLIGIIQQSHNLQPPKGVAAHGEEAVQFLHGKQPTTEVFNCSVPS